MKLEFLGGAGEVGRSAVLVNDALLLDYGMTTDSPATYPLRDPDPEALVVSHGHLDHAGAVPGLLSGTHRPDIHWTPPTAALARELGRDTLKLHGNAPSLPFHQEELHRIGEVEHRHGYGEPFEAAGMTVTLYDAGHIPGSAHVLVDDGETKLLYTGDFHTEDQRLVAGTTARPDADIVITESTYADYERDARDELEGQFAESVRTTLWEGGTVVVPAFAIGRTQEVMAILDAHDVQPYVDGMGTTITKLFRRHPEFLRDPETLKCAKSNARFVSGRDGQRERIADDNTAIVTTSGMLNGGPAMTYVPAIRSRPVNKIALAGYQVEGTPGRELLDTGRAEIDGQVMPVSAQVEYYDFSAHADRNGLLAFLDSYHGAELLVTHGDRCSAFAEELRSDGFDASAPGRGDVVVC